MINQQLADKFDTFDPTPIGTIDLSDPQGLKDWLAGLSATGEIFYQEWNTPSLRKPVWALSIEVDSVWAGSDISQVVDMEGGVPNGHFSLYWSKIFRYRWMTMINGLITQSGRRFPTQVDQVDLLFEKPPWLFIIRTGKPADSPDHGDAMEVLSLRLSIARRSSHGWGIGDCGNGLLVGSASSA